MPSKYFFAVSQLNGLVLDVSGSKKAPGTKVIVHNKKAAGNHNQQWYVDYVTNTIRSRASDLVLDVNGNGDLIINNYNPSNQQQKFGLDEKRGVIHRLVDPNSVLDIRGENRNPGASLLCFTYKASKNQLWSFQFLEPEYMYILSEMHDKVLEVEKGKNAPGTKVCVSRKTDAIHQQWFESRVGIRSRLNNLPLTCGALKDRAPMMIKPAQPKEHQAFWVISGNRIINRANPNYVVDIAESRGTDGAPVVAFPYKGAVNQHWKFKPI